MNKLEMKFKAISQNESFARASVAGFCLPLNPSIDELTDIKTAVSEAVTNAIVHAYLGRQDGEILLTVTTDNHEVEVVIEDNGVGIPDIERAKQPFYTTKSGDERSGMGFTVMESFMDSLVIENKSGGGVRVIMKKKIKEFAKEEKSVM